LISSSNPQGLEPRDITNNMHIPRFNVAFGTAFCFWLPLGPVTVYAASHVFGKRTDQCILTVVGVRPLPFPP